MLLTPASVSIGTMVKGFGLHNAGLWATVISIGRKSVILEVHRTGKRHRSNLRYWRIA